MVHAQVSDVEAVAEMYLERLSAPPSTPPVADIDNASSTTRLLPLVEASAVPPPADGTPVKPRTNADQVLGGLRLGNVLEARTVDVQGVNTPSSASERRTAKEEAGTVGATASAAVAPGGVLEHPTVDDAPFHSHNTSDSSATTGALHVLCLTLWGSNYILGGCSDATIRVRCVMRNDTQRVSHAAMHWRLEE